MVKSIEEARKILLIFTSEGLGKIERKEVVAFATLEAFTSHFPGLCTAADRRILLGSQCIFVQEKDRFYKQRRIALARLAEEYNLEEKKSILESSHSLQLT